MQVRKCMSVILRRESGELALLTKGAESSILPKCPQDEVSSQNLMSRDLMTQETHDMI